MGLMTDFKHSEMALSLSLSLYRVRNKGLYVVARNFSCSCLTVLPGPAWVLLTNIYIPLFRALYSATRQHVAQEMEGN